MNSALLQQRQPLPRPRLSTPAAILFDLDGTLVDTMGRFADLAAEIMASHHGTAVPFARLWYLHTSGAPFAHQLQIIYGANPRNEAAVADFENRKQSIARAANMTPSEVEALARLRRRGLRLVVSSNGMQDHVDHFASRYRHGGAPLFDLALGFAGAGTGKGEPHVRRVTETLGLGRGDLLFVGDSLRDGELAEETGLGFIGRIGTLARNELARRFPSAPLIGSVAELGDLFSV